MKFYIWKFVIDTFLTFLSDPTVIVQVPRCAFVNAPRRRHAVQTFSGPDVSQPPALWFSIRTPLFHPVMWLRNYYAFFSLHEYDNFEKASLDGSTKLLNSVVLTQNLSTILRYLLIFFKSTWPFSLSFSPNSYLSLEHSLAFCVLKIKEYPTTQFNSQKCVSFSFHTVYTHCFVCCSFIVL